MQRLHHRLELVHGVRDAVARVRREEADGVVAPVVHEAALHERAVVDERVHREELHGGHAERFQVVHHLRRREAREAALERRRHVRVALRVSAHVHLVDDPLVAREVRMAVVAPAERRVDHLAAGHGGGVVAPVEGQVLALLPDGVAVVGVAPAHVAHDAARVGVEEELVRVEAVPLLGLVGAVHAVAVELPRPRLRKVAVPDEIGALAKRDALRLAPSRLVEEAELDPLGVAREEGEVHALAVPRRPERMRRSLPQLGHRLRGEPCRHCPASSRSPWSGIAIQSGRCAIS